MNSFTDLVTIFNKVPLDVFIHIIKYIDATPSTIAIRKNKKKLITDKINNALSTRSNDNLIDNEHWIFGFIPDIDNETLQLQGINCNRCGNYAHPLILTTPNRMKCFCV